jgi:hypothetical protein
MKYKCGCDHHKLCSSFLRFWGPCIALGKNQGPEMSQGRTCLRAGLVSGAWNYCFIIKLRRTGWEGAKISRGQSCQSTFGPDLSQGWTCLGAGLVLRPELSWGGNCLGADLSQGRTCLRAGLDQKLRGRKCPKASGPEVSRGRKCPKV